MFALPDDDFMAYLTARGHQTPPAWLASGEPARVITPTDVTRVRHRHVRDEQLTLGLGGEELVFALHRPKDGFPFLRRAAQRAFGFGVVPATDFDDLVLDLKVAGREDSDCGLIALRDGLRLFELPPMDGAARVRGIAGSAGSHVLSVVSLTGHRDGDSGDRGAPGWSARESHVDRYVGKLRRGKQEPIAPAEAGAGPGRVTAVTLDEREPGPIRVYVTVDGRVIELRASSKPDARANLRHLVAAGLGTNARVAD